MNAFIGAYGDSIAHTPHLDKLAASGSIYEHAYATAPVCSPSRSCLITGLYASSFGAQHLRSVIDLPDTIVPFPKYLRAAGYYCTNNGKEDYNFIDTAIWDDHSAEAHWRGRKKKQPFFSVFNIMTTHQSQIFGSDEAFEEKYGQHIESQLRQDPDKIFVPPYHFDTPVVRKLWARYYDLVTLMDRQVGEIIAALEADGQLDNTIIFYFSDHGTGMPRSKRSLYDSGLRVPLIISAPKKWRNKLDLIPGSVNEEMVSFVDFAPTILNLCGITIPGVMQGIPFLGTDKDKRKFVYGHSDRVDEAYEISRTLRSNRYRYVRNYLPHFPLIQDNFYTDQSEIMQELRSNYDDGNLTAAQASMWANRRAAEELYDTNVDPYEVHNLAREFDHLPVIKEFRREMRSQLLRIKDTGLMHEIDMHSLSQDKTIYETARDTALFSILEILSIVNPEKTESWSEIDIVDHLDHPNQIIRFWAFTMLESKGWQRPNTRAAIEKAIDDPAPSVRIAACRAMLREADNAKASNVLFQELENKDERVRLTAARAIEQFIEKRKFDKKALSNFINNNCPQEDWNEYYKLYTCWALEAAMGE